MVKGHIAMKIKVNQRKMLINLLEMKYSMNKLHNGRKLNRLSTKQLEKKIEGIERNYSKQTTTYVSFLNSFNFA